VVNGIFKEIKRSIKETLKNNNPITLFSGPKKITNISEQRVTSKVYIHSQTALLE